jgi:virginiamycin B lyase
MNWLGSVWTSRAVRRAAAPRRTPAARSRPAVEALEDRCLLAANLSVMDFPQVASQVVQTPTGIVLGHDGLFWFTDTGLNAIGVVKDQNVSLGVLPTPNSLPTSIVSGEDTSLWFTERNTGKIGRLTPRAVGPGVYNDPLQTPDQARISPDPNSLGVVQEFAIPSGSSPADIAFSPGVFSSASDTAPTLTNPNLSQVPALWFTMPDDNRIGYIRTSSPNQIEEVVVPTPNSLPTDITSGGDGSAWFTMPGTNQLGHVSKINRQDSGDQTAQRIFPIDEIVIPTANALPAGIAVAPDGVVWFTESNTDKLGYITPDGVVREIASGGPSDPLVFHNPTSITVASDGTVWFISNGSDTVLVGYKPGHGDSQGGYAPAAGEVIYTTLEANSNPLGVSTGRHQVAVTEAGNGSNPGRIALVQSGFDNNGLDSDHSFVMSLYVNVLGRQNEVTTTPQPGKVTQAELDSWVNLLDQLRSQSSLTDDQQRLQIVTQIEHSAEARTRLVKSWYLTYLGRAAQNGEEQGWVQQMVVGGATEAQVLAGILSSVEFSFRLTFLVTAPPSPSSDEAFVRNLYGTLLGRTADASGLSFWLTALPTIGRAGVVQGFLSSAEYTEQRVLAYYRDLLHRPDQPLATQGELKSWLGRNLSTEQIRLLFRASEEYYSNAAAETFDLFSDLPVV